jgi:PST family polysaccharide transporter
VNLPWGKLLPPFLRRRLEGRETLLKVAGNAGWLAGEKILRMGIGLFVGVWVARYLGPGQFGVFNYVIAFVTLFFPLATVGLDQLIVREIVREPEQKQSVLGTGLLLRLIGSTLAFGLAIGAIILFRPGESGMHLFAIIVSIHLFFRSFDVIEFWFQSQVQSKYVVLARSGTLFLVAGIRIVLVLIQAPLVAFFWAFTIEYVLMAIGMLGAYRMTGGRIGHWKWNFASARVLLNDAWPLIFTGMVILIYMKIDQIMLGSMVGEQSVGIYAAAVRISELGYFIPVAIVSSVLPSLTEARQKSEQLYYQRLQKLFDGMSALALAIIIAVLPLSNFVILTLYGEAYRQSIHMLNIHILACLFVFLGTAQSPWNITEGLTKLHFSRTLSGAIINVGLNILLIPPYAGIGAAVATVVSYAFSGCILNLLHPKTRVIFIMQVKSLFFVRYIRGIV